MEQVCAQSEGRKTQGQRQHGFLQLWNKFMHSLRARKRMDSISTDFCSYERVHTLPERETAGTVSARISATMEQVHALAEGKKTPGQHHHGFLHRWNEFTHRLRARKCRESVSADLCSYGMSSRTR